MESKQKGFSALHVLLLFVIVGIIGGTGWYVYKATKSANKTLDATNNSSAITAKSKTPAAANPDPSTKKETTKEYKNTDYGFSFTYPSSWKFEEKLEDIGRGKPEGSVTVISPNGTIVKFSPNLGGKGGDCWDDQANARTERTCMTADILSLDQFPSGIEGRTFYLYEAKVSPAKRDGGSPEYRIGLRDNDYEAPTTGPKLTPVFIDIISTGKGNINIDVNGRSDSDKISSSFLSSTEAKEAAPVLKTLRLL